MARIAGLEFEPLYLIKDEDDVMLSMRYRTTSNAAAVAVGQNCGGTGSSSNIEFSYCRKYATKIQRYHHFSSKIMGNHRVFYEGIIYNDKVDNGFLFTTEKNVVEDLYEYLLAKYPFPLLKEWSKYLFASLTAVDAVKKVYSPVVVGNGFNPDEKCMIIHGDREIPSNELYVLDAQGVSEEVLKGVISRGLEERKIYVDNETHKIMKPLNIKGVNDYMERFSGKICESLRQNNLFPKQKSKLRSVPGMALLSRKLYAPQADSTNAIVASMKAGDKYVFVSEEMGCGKTIQASSAVEAYYNQKWLRQHKGKTLRDCYESGEVAYRAVIMCPSHLCVKWKHEVESQIPGARGIIVSSLPQLAALRKLSPKKRNGKEFWIFSKEIAKMDTHKRPVPTTVGKKVPVISICYDCLKNSMSEENEGHRKILSKRKAWGAGELANGSFTKSPMLIKDGIPTCVTCGGHRGHLLELEYPYTFMDEKGEYRTTNAYKGMLCPCCGNLLLRNGSAYVLLKNRVEEFDNYVLDIGKFATKAVGNEVCHVCGTSLWEDNVAPMNIPLTGKPAVIEAEQEIVFDENGFPTFVDKEVKKWVKIKVCPDHAKAKLEDPKKRICSKGYYALKGHEQETVAVKGVGTEYAYSQREYGPRRYSTARYAKKYLKGYFDILIADECHLYEGDKTEQAIALHCLMKTVDFSMLLTGTLTNGTASSLFNIHFMCNPARMKELGFELNAESARRFAENYGVVEKKFMCSESGDGSYNAQGRGQQLGKETIKPGISPIVYPDILLDHTVQLNIADMSNKLPPLNEYVVQVDMNREQEDGYLKNIEVIKDAIKDRNFGVGKGLMGKMLQLGLSYPDKPYGRSDVYSLRVPDWLIVSPDNLEQYASVDVLLPKEEKLVEIVRKEISEGRQVFVYTEYSGSEETGIDDRLQEIIESHCNLRGQVSVLRSRSVKAIDRDEYIKKNADKVKVFITNYRNVETGIDFVGEYEGRRYNYPTIIFFQTGMSLSSIWQASRRHYRLNQTEECRTYYLCYKKTFQLDILEMMSKKISAASAIQGNFSESALENMAGTDDPAVILAKKIAKGQTGGDVDGTEIEDQLSMSRKLAIEACDESQFIGDEPVTYYDIMGDGASYQSALNIEEEEVTAACVPSSPAANTNEFSSKSNEELLAAVGSFFEQMAVVVTEEEAKKVKKKTARPMAGQVALFSF